MQIITLNVRVESEYVRVGSANQMASIGIVGIYVLWKPE